MSVKKQGSKWRSKLLKKYGIKSISGGSYYDGFTEGLELADKKNKEVEQHVRKDMIKRVIEFIDWDSNNFKNSNDFANVGEYGLHLINEFEKKLLEEKANVKK